MFDLAGALIQSLAPVAVSADVGASVLRTTTWKAKAVGTFRLVAHLEVPSDDSSGNDVQVATVSVSASSLANLAVSPADVSVTPAQVMAGQPVHVNATVRNDGAAAADGFVVTIRNVGSGAELARRTVSSLGAGEATSLAVDLTPKNADPIQLAWQVDVGNSVSESDEDDNAAVITVDPIGLADLSVTSAQVMVVPSFPQTNEAVTVSVTVSNVGGQSTAAASLELFVNDALGAAIGTRQLAALAPGATATESFTSVAPSSGSQLKFIAVVNRAHAFVEESWANNQADRTVAVQDGALALSQPFFSPNGDGVKDTTDIQFRLPSAGMATVSVTDKAGTQVWATQTAVSNAAAVVTWDGVSDAGTIVSDGTYSVEVAGANGLIGRTSVVVDTNRSQLVDAVGTPYLVTNSLSRGVSVARSVQRGLTINLPRSDLVFQTTYLPSGEVVFVGNLPAGGCALFKEDAFGGPPERISRPDFECSNVAVDSTLTASWPYAIASVAQGTKIVILRGRVSVSTELPKFTLEVLDLATGVTTPLSADASLAQYQYGASQAASFVPALTRTPVLSVVDGNPARVTAFSGYGSDGVVKCQGITCYGNAGAYAPALNEYRLPGGLVNDAPARLQFSQCPGAASQCTTAEAQNLAGDMIPLERGGIAWIAWGGVGYSLSPQTSQVLQEPGSAVEALTDFWSDGSTVSSVNDSFRHGIASGRPMMGRRLADLGDAVALAGVDVGNGAGTCVRSGCLLNPGIFVASVQGGVRRVFTAPSTDVLQFTGYANLTASPDKRVLGFTYTPGLALSNGGQLYNDASAVVKVQDIRFLNLASGVVTKVATSSNGAYNLQWSPDGTSITYGTEAAATLANLAVALSAFRGAGQSSLTMQGTAQDLNLDSYVVSARPFGSSAAPTLIGGGTTPVVNGRLGSWVPPAAGLYELQLVVTDKAGNTKTRKTTISWGALPDLTNVLLSDAFVSPNGDAVKDNATLSYSTTQALSTTLTINDGAGNAVRQYARTHLQAGDYFVTWDGRNEAGVVVPDGRYSVQLESFSLPLTVDTVVPAVSLLKLGEPAIATQMAPDTQDGKLHGYETLVARAQHQATDENLDVWSLRANEASGANAEVAQGHTADVLRELFLASEVQGKTFTLSATDRAGNAATSTSVAYAEKVVLAALGDASVLDASNGSLLIGGRVVPRIDLLEPTLDSRGTSKNFSFIPRKWAFSLSSSNGKPLVSYAVAWRAAGSSAPFNVDTLGVEVVSENVIVWDARAIPSQPLEVEIRAQDTAGRLFVVPVQLSHVERPGSLESCTSGMSDNSLHFLLALPLAEGEGAEFQGGATFEVTPRGSSVVAMTVPLRNPGFIVERTETWAADSATGQLSGCLYSVRFRGLLKSGESVVATNDFDLCTLSSSRVSMEQGQITASLHERLPSHLTSVDTLARHPGGQWALIDSRAGFLADTSVSFSSQALGGCGTYELRWVGHQANGVDVDSVQSQANVCSPVSTVQVPCLRVEVVAAQATPPTVDCQMRTTPTAFVVNASTQGTATIQSMTSWLETASGTVVEPLPVVGFTPLGQSAVGQVNVASIGLPDGPYFVAAEIVDSFGAHALARGPKPAFLIDSTPPLASLSALPLHVCANQQVLPVSGSVSDQELVGYAVSLSKDQGLFQSNFDRGFSPTSASVSAAGNLSLAGLSSGDYWARLSGRDGFGNSACSAARPVHVEADVHFGALTVLPSLISPDGDGVLEVATAVFSVSEPAAVQVDLVRGDGSVVPLQTLNAQPAAQYSLPLSVSGQADGQYQVRVSATTPCGSTAAPSLALGVDTHAPSAAILQPGIDGADAFGSIAVTGVAADPNFLNYEVAVGQGTSPSTFTRVAFGASEPGSKLGTVDTAALAVGPSVIRLVVNDLAGHSTTVTRSINVVRAKLLSSFHLRDSAVSPNGDGQLDETVALGTLETSAHLVLELVSQTGTTSTIADLANAPAGAFSVPLSTSVLSSVADGTYQVRATASSGTTNEALSAVLEIDRGAPAIAIAQPVEGAVVRPATDVRVSVAGASSWSLTLNQSGSSVMKQGTGDFDGVAGYLSTEGPLELVLHAVDRAGNVADLHRNVTIDSLAPAVSLGQPGDGSFAGGVVHLTGSASDFNFASLELAWVRGSTRTVITTLQTVPSNGALGDWDTTALPDGPITVEARAADKAGNFSVTHVSLTLDNSPPVVALASPSGIVARSALVFSGRVSDLNVKDWVVEFGAPPPQDAASFVQVLSGTQNVEGVLGQPVSLPPNGRYRVRCRATDRAGNESVDERIVTIQDQPADPPYVAPPTNLQVALVGGSTAALTWTSSVSAGVEKYLVHRNGIVAATVTTTQFQDVSLANGSYTYDVVAIDQDLTQSAASAAVTVSVDTASPLVMITNPTGGSRVGGVRQVLGAATGGANFLSYELGLGVGATPPSYRRLAMSASPVVQGPLGMLDTGVLSEGALYTLKLSATSRFGGTVETTAQFVVDNTPPDAPVLTSLSNAGAVVSIAWQPSIAGDLQGYLVLRDEQIANAPPGASVSDFAAWLLPATATSYSETVKDGTHVYVVLAVDAAQNLSARSNSRSVTIETRAPTAVIVSPDAGSVVTVPTTLVVSLSDEDVASVRFEAKPSGSSVFTAFDTSSSPPFGVVLSPARFGMMSVEVRAVAKDTTGHEDVSAAVNTYRLEQPLTPSKLAARVDAFTVHASWQPASASVDHFELSSPLGLQTLARSVTTADLQLPSLDPFSITLRTVSHFGLSEVETVTVNATTPRFDAFPSNIVLQMPVLATGSGAHAGDAIVVTRVDTGESLGTAYADEAGHFSLSLTYAKGGFLIRGVAVDTSGSRSVPFQTSVPYLQTESSAVPVLALQSLTKGQPTFSLAMSGDVSAVASVSLWRRDTQGVVSQVANAAFPSATLVDSSATFGVFQYFARLSGSSMLDKDSNVVTVDNVVPTLTLSVVADGNNSHVAFHAEYVNGQALNRVALMRQAPGEAPVTLATLSGAPASLTDSAPVAGVADYSLLGSGVSNQNTVPSNVVTVTRASAFDAPTTLVATVDPAKQQVQLVWQSAAGPTAFDVERSPDQSPRVFAVLGTTSAKSTSDSPGAGSFWYRVRGRSGSAVGSYSTQVLVHVPIGAPIFTAPETGTTVAVSVAPVSGLAAAPGKVEILRSHDRVVASANATTGSSLLVRQQMQIQAAEPPSLSADGRRVAYASSADFQQLMVSRVCAPNESCVSNDAFVSGLIFHGPYVFSPDGNKLAGIGTDPNSLETKLFIANVSEGSFSQATRPIDGSQSGPVAWSSDSNSVAFVDSVKGVETYSLIFSPFGQIVQLRALNSEVVTELAWGSQSVYGILSVTTPSPSQSIEAWSSFSPRSVVVSSQGLAELTIAGGRALAAQFDGFSWNAVTFNDVFFPSAQTVYLSASQKPLLALDPKGTSFVSISNGQVDTSPFNGGVTHWGALGASLTNVRGFTWGSAPKPMMWLQDAQTGAEAPTQLLLGYGFQASVPLLTGENLLSARSVAADGTFGVEGSELAITSTAVSPDLTVTATLLPEMPTSGDVVSAVISVGNAGLVASDAPDVRITVVSSSGVSRTVTAHAPSGCGPSKTVQFFVPLDLTGFSGGQTLIAVVDPLQALPDADRTNNTFSRAFIIAPNVLPSATLATARTGDALSTSVTVFNPGAAAEVTTRVRVESQAGSALIESEDDIAAMAAASTRAFDRTFDLSSLSAGSYVLAAEVFVRGNQVSRTTEAVTVVRPVTATLSVVATRSAFGPSDAIGLEAFVLNTSASQLLQGAALEVVVRNGLGAEMVSQSVSLPVVSAGNSVTQTISFPPKTLIPGVYSATVTLSVGGDLLTTASASFRVDGAPLLAGSISVSNATGSPPTIRQGQPVQLAFELKNLGTATASTSEIAASLIDSTTGSVVDVQSQVTGDLVASASTSGTLVFSVPLALKTYGLAFAARSNGSSFSVLATTTVQVLDGLPPELQIVGLPQDILVKNPLLVRVHATDATGVAQVRVSVDGAAPQQLSLTNGSAVVGDWDATLTLSPDGSHLLTFSAVDLDGQDGLLFATTSNPTTRRVRLDTTPPLLAVSGVSNGGHYDAVVAPLISATDSNGVTVTALLDGAHFESGSAIGDGVHTLVVTAIDGASNVTTWQATFAVDTLPPLIVLNGASEGAVLSPPATISYQVFDTSATLVDASIDGASFSDATTVAALGAHTVIVHAVDSAGHERTVTAHFTVGSASLSVAIAGVVDGTFVNAAVTPVVTFTGASSQSITLNGAAFASGTSITTDGTYTLIATAASATGEVATQTVHFTVDRTQPGLSLVGVADQAAVANSVTLEFAAQDSNLVSLKSTLDGQVIASGALVSVDGTHVWVVEANDRAGNASSETRTFIIDRLAPVITIVGAHDGQVSATALKPEVTIVETNPATTTITLDGTPYASGATIDTEGDHVLRVDVTDRAGNHAAVTMHFAIDTHAPQLTLAGVADGDVVNHAVTLTFEAADPHLETVSSSVDGQVIATGASVSVEGTHVWHTEARDTAGNTVSVDRSFIIDVTPPSISVSGVLEGEMTNQDVVPVATVTGAAQVVMSLDAAPIGSGATISAEGAHLLKVDAADVAGNTASVVIHFTIDKTPPSVSMTGVTDGATVGGAVTLSFAAVDPFLASVQSTLDGSPIATGAVISAEGPHVWNLDAVDAAGNATHRSVQFTIDATRPVIGIAGVANGAIVAVDVTLTVTVSDASLTQTTTTLDGVAFTSGDTVSTEGTHSLHVSAVDRAGNTASAELSFTIDKTKPVLSLSGVSDGQVLNHSVTLVFSAADSHLASVTSAVDGSSVATGANVSAPGAHVWVVTATDTAGNTTSETRGFTIDTQPPVITISGVTEGQLSRVALAPVITISGATTSTTKLNGVAFISGTTVSTDGAYSLDVSATDAAGNSATAHVGFTIDSAPPVLSLTGVPEGAVVHGPVTLVFSASDASSVTLTASLDGVTVASGVVVTLEGSHRLDLTARDAAGNEATLQRHFVIDSTPPVIVITGVTAGQSGTTPVAPVFSATDAHLVTVTGSLNGAAFTSGTTISLAGSYSLVVTAVDAAGNSASQTVLFSITSSGNVTCRSPRLTAVRTSVPHVATYDAVATPLPTLRFTVPPSAKVDRDGHERDKGGSPIVESTLSFGQGANSTVCTYRGTSDTLPLLSCVPSVTSGTVVSADWLRLSVTKGLTSPKGTYVSVVLTEKEPCRGAVLEPVFSYAACSLRTMSVSHTAQVVGSLAANVDLTLTGDAEVRGDVVSGHDLTRSSHADLDGVAYYGGRASLSCVPGCRHGECPESHHIVPAPMPCECGYELGARLAEVALNNDNNLLAADPAVSPLFVGGALNIRQSEIRLGAGRYSLTSLTMTGGAIRVAEDEVVELFVSGNVDIRLPARISAEHGGRLVIVSGAKSANGGTVSVRPREAENLQVYAPEADITLDGPVRIEGAVVGRDVNLTGNSELRLAPGRQVSPPPLTCQ